MRLAVVVLLAVITACGGGSPIRPSPPSLAQPSIVAASEGVTFHTECPDGQCAYGFEIRNAGSGCGRAVRGTISLVNASSTVIATDEWALPTEQIVSPGATVGVSDCCVAEAAVVSATTVRLTFQAEAVTCQ